MVADRTDVGRHTKKGVWDLGNGEGNMNTAPRIFSGDGKVGLPGKIAGVNLIMVKG